MPSRNPLHLRKSSKVDDLLWESPVFFAGNEPSFPIQTGYPKFDIKNVMINDEERFKNTPNYVWNFHISGYQVCHK